MIPIRSYLFTASLGALSLAAQPLAAQTRADTSTLTARLGVDTISVERIVRTRSSVEAELVTRSPRTALERHRAMFDESGMLATLEMTQLDPRTGAVIRRVGYARDGDSLLVTTQTDSTRTERRVAAPREALPFVDLVHWPFDVALRRLRASGERETSAPLLQGTRISGFPLALIGNDSATVTHPTRGTMRLQVLADGSIRTLDAGATTRALVVTRSGNVDVPALARDFAERDAAGRGIGELSGRGGGDASALGATINLDYGTPVKRGRVIWGTVVRYGQLWRTGANTATHFSTDVPLRFGTLEVPAGRYTLFSIIEADGGVMIINRQTGQNGQTYDPARDLGRVRLTRRPLSTPVEVFSIAVREEGGRGILALQWDSSEFVAEFTRVTP